MKNNLVFIGIFLLITLILTGCLKQEKNMGPTQNLSLADKKVVLVIAFQGFQDQEYNQTRKVLEDQGAKITVASWSTGMAQGKFGSSVKVDKSIEEINAADFEAIVFVGGPGAADYFGNKTAHRLAQEAVAQNKVLAAICIAPAILAKAGVLKGKKATVWSAPFDRGSVEILKTEGAEYLDQPVVVDGKIVTANGPSAAEEFGRAIVEALVR